MSSDVATAAVPWWRGGVIYQIYPRSFLDTDGDGLGDLRGVTEQLGHVAQLGADAVWLSPFYPSPQRDFGYDITDHRAVDPALGTMADFEALATRAKSLGLHVLVDLICGHTSDQHAWFRSSCENPPGPHGDFYVWADPQPDGSPPCNWLSVFGGSAWSWEPRRRQFFLHHFLAEQPTLNIRCPGVVEALLETARFWLERGISGFRLDAVDFLAHDPALTNNSPAPPLPGGPPMKLFAMQQHEHDMMHPDSLGFLARLRTLVDAYPGAVLLGELSSQPGEGERIERLAGPAGPLHLAYSLAPARAALSRELVLGLVAAASRDAWRCWSLSNHDVERVASRWSPGGAPDPAVARLALALLLSLRGSPCLYQGEELGLPNAELSYEQLRDPFGLRFWPMFPGRDGSRTPLPWSSVLPHGGFSTAKPWLPVPEAHIRLAVDTQSHDPYSTLRFATELFRFRAMHPALAQGTAQALLLPAPLVGFERQAGSSRIACLFNLSPAPVVAELGPWSGGLPLWPQAGDPWGPTLALPPWGAVFADLKAVPPAS